MTEQDYYMKRDSLIKKFNPEFIEKNLRYDPMLNQIFEMLIRDASPYSMIEILVEERIRMSDQMTRIIAMSTQPLTVITP